MIDVHWHEKKNGVRKEIWLDNVKSKKRNIIAYLFKFIIFKHKFTYQKSNAMQLYNRITLTTPIYTII